MYFGPGDGRYKEGCGGSKRCRGEDSEERDADRRLRIARFVVRGRFGVRVRGRKQSIPIQGLLEREERSLLRMNGEG